MLGTGATVAIVALIAGPANARAPGAKLDGIGAVAARSGITAASARYVYIAGTVTWKQTTTPPYYTGGDTTTGTFNINLTELGAGDIVKNKSTYSLSDDLNRKTVYQTGDGTCTETDTGHYSASGTLNYANPSPLVVEKDTLPSQKTVGLYIDDDYPETETITTTGPAGCDPGTTTQTLQDESIPQCFKNHSYDPVSGIFKGKFPDGSVNVACAGSGPWGAGKVTYSIAGTLVFNTSCVPPAQPSGPWWVEKFPDSRSVSTLSDPFQQHVTNFINAMQKAGIAVGVNSTRRPLQRAYLMHYSWLIANNKIDPRDVPKFHPAAGQEPVNICWVRTNSSGADDLPASIAAAQQMVSDYHIASKVAPQLNSLHTKGLAIDMNTTWSQPVITIVDGSGHDVPINTTPQDGLNTQLMAVGLTYFVHHFCYPAGACDTDVPAQDPIHWSVNGH
jgi:hypothetical protein